jgi:hypothetical protein
MLNVAQRIKPSNPKILFIFLNRRRTNEHC